MYLRLSLLVLFLAAVISPIWSASSGELILKNASHADSIVGPSPQDGISQGHDLKIVLQKISFGNNMADAASVDVTIRHGNQTYQQLQAQLNETGYTEILFTIPGDWGGLYQVDVAIAGKRNKNWSGSQPFRVIPAEPGSDVPEASSLALLGAALIAFSLCWRPLAQRD